MNAATVSRLVHPLFQAEGGGSIPTSPLQLHVGRIAVKPRLRPAAPEGAK